MGTAFDSTKKHNQGSTAQEPSSAPAGASSHSSSPSSLLEEGERHVTRTVIKLAWPSILEQLLISMATLADTAMVGSIGASATAAVAVNISSVWLINGFITALSVGCSYLAAHAVGSGSVHRTHSVTYQSITCSLILGLLLFFGVELVCRPLPIWLGAAPDVVPMAQSYMRVIGFGLIPQSVAVVLSSLFRSAGDTRTPLAANLTSNMANIIGNFFLIYPARDVVLGGRTIFIWGAGLGVTGAAISTAASQYLLFFILLWFLSHKDTPVRIPLLRPRYRIQRRVFRQLWHISFPVLLERLTLTSGQIALTAMISGLGTVPLAAHSLTNQTEGIMYLPAYGFSYTATALIGQSLGAGRKDLADRFALSICLIGSAVIVMVCIPVAIWSGPIIRLFTSDPDVAVLGAQTLFIAAATEIFFSFFVIACGICRGAGDVRFSLLVSVIGMWGLRIGLVYIATRPLQMGVVGVWIAIAVDCFIRSVLCIWRLRSGKWKNHTA